MKNSAVILCALTLELTTLALKAQECVNITHEISDTRGEMITDSMKKNFKLPRAAFGKSLIISRRIETCSDGTKKTTEKINFEGKRYTYSHSS